MINRLKNLEPQIREVGHAVRFATSRGPFNIATFLMGTTEFMMLLNMEPEKAHELMEKITRFMCDWLRYQKKCFPGIDGIHILDDIVGFVGDDECHEFVAPYLKRIYQAFDSKVRFFHNDAYGLTCAPFFSEIGINLFNFTFDHTIDEMRAAAGPNVALLGNLPPRDVLAAETPEVVYASTQEMMRNTTDKSRIVWSCGGGMPQDVPTENIKAFISAVNNFS
jgi:uroporphyrinogen decarboxylase